MAFGPEVGSVSVRVIPDTRKFRIEANKQLRALRKDLTELKAKIVPDLDKAFAKQAKQIEKKPVKASVKADLEGFQKQALAELKKTALKLDAKIPLTPDGERLRKSAAAAMKDLEDRIKAKVPLDVELASDGRRKIRSELDYLKSQVDVPPFELKVDADSSKARQQLLDLYRQIPQMADEGRNRIILRINDSRVKEELRTAIAALKAEAALADIEVSMSVDAGPVSSLGAVGAMLSRFSAIGAGAAAVLTLVLGPALSLVAGALVALPGLLAGVAIPMGAVALMTTDLAKAFEKVTGPIAELGPPLIELQNSVKGSFFAGFTGELNGTANGITILKDAIGQLSGPLNNLTGALGEALTGAIQGLLSGGGLEAMKKLITNIGDGFRTAAPAIGQLVASLAKMAAAMTGTGMVEAFTKFANSFSAWIGKDENIKKVQDALTGLLDVVTSMGPELGNIFKDALKTMGDPNFVKNIKEIVTGLLELIGVVAALGNMFASTKDTFLGAFNGGPIQMLVGFFTDALRSMTEGWGNFTSLLGTGLTNAFTGIGAVLSAIWTGIVTAMQGAWDTVVTLITAKFQQLPQSIQNVIGGIIGVFGSLVSTIANVVGQIPGVVASTFGQVASVIAGAVGSFVAAAVNGFGQLVSTIVSAMGQALAAVVSGTGNIVSEVSTLGGRVVSAVSGFVGAMVSAGADLIAGLARGIASAAGNAIAAAANVGRQIIGAVKGIFNSNSPSKVFMGIGGDVVDGLTIGIGQKQHLASDRAAGMAQNVVDGARKVIADGIDPLMVDVQIDPEALEKLKKEKDLLDLQAKTLGVQKDQAPDKMAKAALQAQLDQINARKREIALIQEQANYQKKYGSDVEDTASKYSNLLGAAQDIPTNFAKANINQFTKDLGMSGQGAIPDLISQGANYVFQVLDLESAISGMTRVQSKNALAQR